MRRIKQIHIIFPKDVSSAVEECARKHADKVEVCDDCNSFRPEDIEENGKGVVVFCSDDATPPISLDKEAYFSAMLPVVRQRAGEKADVVLVCSSRETFDSLSPLCKENGIRAMLGENPANVVEEYLKGNAGIVSGRRTAQGVKILFALADETGGEIAEKFKPVAGAEIIGFERTKEDALKRALEEKPHIVVADIDIPGGIDIIRMAADIPLETRILIPYPHGATEVVRERLEQLGAEFFDSGLEKEEIEKIVYRIRAKDEEKEETAPGQETGKATRGVEVSIPLSVRKRLLAKTPKLRRQVLANVTAVVSPCACGKTFVAENLAYKFADLGHGVALVDFSEKGDMFWHFRIPKGENSLKRAIDGAPSGEESSQDYPEMGFSNKRIRGIKVFTCDPVVRKEMRFDTEDAAAFLKFVSEAFGHVVIDVSSPWDMKVVERAGSVVYVFDADSSHVGNCLESIRGYAEMAKGKRVAGAFNKYEEKLAKETEFADAQIKHALGLEKTIKIPCRHYASLCGQIAGLPACSLDGELSRDFLELAREITVKGRDKNNV